MAVRHLGHQVGGRRRNDDQVALARQSDMADILLVLARKEIDIDVRGGQRADGKRGHELLRAGRHHRPHARPAFPQTSDEIEALIGRDAAGDDQENTLARQCHLHPAFRPSSCPAWAAGFYAIPEYSSGWPHQRLRDRTYLSDPLRATCPTGGGSLR
ncbi:hypothetical protein D9M68_492800 [compost metagenome]